MAITTNLTTAADIQYTTKDGDVLDEILTRHYSTNGVSILRKVLLANPGLARRGTVYPSGVKITLPVIPKSVIVPIVRPWGTLS